LRPDTSPRRGSRRRRARLRAGRAFSRQIGLRQVRRGSAQHLVLLLQQPIPPTQLPQLRGLSSRRSGLGTVVDIGLAHPLRQRHRMHSEIGGDLLDRYAVITVARDSHYTIAELFRVRTWAQRHPSRPPLRASPLRCHLIMQQTKSTCAASLSLPPRTEGRAARRSMLSVTPQQWHVKDG
jgi:hypothetical protein